MRYAGLTKLMQIMHGTTGSLLLCYTPYIGATRLNSIENTLLMFSQYRAPKCAGVRTCPRFILFLSSLILTIFQQHNSFGKVRPRDIEISLSQNEIALLSLSIQLWSIMSRLAEKKVHGFVCGTDFYC